MSENHIFAACPSCATTWKTRHEFLLDPSLILNGYQASIKNLETGLLLFTHHRENCRTTMGIRVMEFLDLYSGERYSENRALSPGCPRYCIDEKRLDRCDVLCECAFVREIVHKIVLVKNQPLPNFII